MAKEAICPKAHVLVWDALEDVLLAVIRLIVRSRHRVIVAGVVIIAIPRVIKNVCRHVKKHVSNRVWQTLLHLQNHLHLTVVSEVVLDAAHQDAAHAVVPVIVTVIHLPRQQERVMVTVWVDVKQDVINLVMQLANCSVIVAVAQDAPDAGIHVPLAVH